MHSLPRRRFTAYNANLNLDFAKMIICNTGTRPGCIDKKSKEILIVEVGITSIDNLQQVETEKLKKYDLIANELTQLYGFKSVIIPYVLTWYGVVTKYHDIHRRRLGISDRIEAYIQSLVLKKTLESIFLDFKRNGTLEEFASEESTGCPKPMMGKPEPMTSLLE